MSMPATNSAKYLDAEGAGDSVLIVDDDETSVEILTSILAQRGYTTYAAYNGENAIKLYKKYKPTIILLDIIMDGMDGYEVAENISKTYGDRFVPIIFITTLSDPESLVKCMQVGGVDFITKPYNQALLYSKIHIFSQLSRLYQTVQRQRDELEVHNKSIKSSYEVAENVFNKAIYTEVLNLDFIRYLLSPIAIFNGDVLLAAYRPTGELQVMLGDFTGHGLTAAIGAIPVADIFYGMTAKGFSIVEIIQEINNKIHRILPRGYFLAACLFEYEPESHKVCFWNAGIPDVLIYNCQEAKVTQHFQSKNFPFGVKKDVAITDTLEHYQLTKGDHILMYTDGVVEARNFAGNMYGMKRLLDCLSSSTEPWLINSIITDLREYARGEGHDDTTIVEFNMDHVETRVAENRTVVYPNPILESEWKMSFCFGPTILQNVDPLPNMVQALMDIQKLQRYKQDIFIIIKELFTNAFEHGLLRLRSDMKNSPEGFSKYVSEKERRLAELSQGIISVEIVHQQHEQGGMLDVYVYDTGPGFNVASLEQQDSNENQYHGRGILLVKSICESLSFNDKGNEVHARYVWKA